jgi:hypothetical protein
VRPSACPFTGCRRCRRPSICADTAFRLSGVVVPKHIASGILALIDRLQQRGDGLCHGDIYPENVIMTADGPG